jgi:hypothetical protein
MRRPVGPQEDAARRRAPCLSPHPNQPYPPPPAAAAAAARSCTARRGGQRTARELGFVAEQSFRCQRGERNFEKIRLCGGGSLDGGNTCAIAEEGTSRWRSEGRGRQAGRCTCATGRHTKTVRVEDAGDGRGLPTPSPVTGPHASGRAKPSPRATRTTTSCSTCSSASGDQQPASNRIGRHGFEHGIYLTVLHSIQSIIAKANLCSQAREESGR